MQPRTRTQYLFRNTTVRTQRSRIEALNNQTPSAMNWSNISAVIDEEGTTGFVRAIGFTGSTTLLVSVPQDVVFAGVGEFAVLVTASADTTKLKYTGSIAVAAIGTSVTRVPISPGDYVAFYATCPAAFGPLTVTVTDNPTATTIGTFEVQVEV